MNYLKQYSIFVFIFALTSHFSACQGPTEVKTTNAAEPNEWYLFPTWSPTGDWIAYEYYGLDAPWGIWLVRPDGSENHFETKGILADFSPDGKKLALVRGEKIFVYDLETKESTQLTFEGNKSFPDWSPSGTQIAYYDLLGQPLLLLMDANGENKKPLIPVEHNHGAWPKWFPNYRILFSRGTQDDNNNSNSIDLFAMDSTGHNVVQLTQGGAANWNARISLDGLFIVWERWGDPADYQNAVWLMNSDGTDKKRLADGFEPDWAPDGRHIIYRRKGDFIPGQPYDDDDPKVHGSLWIRNVESNVEWQFLPKD